jgi:glyoxylase-like metal-dependent hydrolase (beta-lactamase superfamily II)
MSSSHAYTIDLIRAGQADVRGPEVYWMSNWDGWETLSFYVVLVQGHGRRLLINTGISRPNELLDSLWVQYTGAPRAAMRLDRDVLDVLRDRGTPPDSITDIVLSPLQAYSVSNVPAFPNAAIHILRSGWAAFHAPPGLPADHTQSRECAIPRDVLIHLVCDAWPRLHLLDEEDQIAPGITSFFAGVHHPESIAVTISTAAGPVTWTDGIFKLGNLENSQAVGLTRSLAESAALERRLRQIGGTVLPAFDDTLLDIYPGGHVA